MFRFLLKAGRHLGIIVFPESQNQLVPGGESESGVKTIIKVRYSILKVCFLNQLEGK